MGTGWGVLAGLISLAGYVRYLWAAARGPARPERVAWAVWVAEYGVLLAAQVKAGAGPGLWLPGLQCAGSVAVLAVAIRHGTGGLTRGRAAMLVAVAAALVAWWLTARPAAALAIALTVEGSGMALTIASAWRAQSEDQLFWVLCVAAGACDVPALAYHHAPGYLYAYPVFFVVMGGAVLVACRCGRRAHRRAWPPTGGEPGLPLSGQLLDHRLAQVPLPRAQPGTIGQPAAVPHRTRPLSPAGAVTAGRSPLGWHGMSGAAAARRRPIPASVAPRAGDLPAGPARGVIIFFVPLCPTGIPSERVFP